MDDQAGWKYPQPLFGLLNVADRSGYQAIAARINRSGADLLSVQHEYGLYGGEAGSHLLDLIRALTLPIVTTLHTVLKNPTPAQKRVMDEVLRLSERIIVMSRTATRILNEVHDTNPDKISLIPHGIPTVSRGCGDDLRVRLNIKGPMILTFGLLSPDKGIEAVIRAMPKILQSHPDAVYYIVGATHPQHLACMGDDYRVQLRKEVSDLGLKDSVKFDERFVSKEELVEYLGAMDIYVTPYLNAAQITSGTLAYAVGAGKTVISTPYIYAEELLDEGRGLLVPFRAPEAIADAVTQIESDPVFKREMGERAAAYGEGMLWETVGHQYHETFEDVLRERSQRMRLPLTARPAAPRRELALPGLNLSHFEAMTDDTGMLQHAVYATPRRRDGYCVDDNARAMILTCQIEAEGTLSPSMHRDQGAYLSFVHHAMNEETGRFRNFMSYDRQWLDEGGSEDSHGRTMWSLGTMVSHSKTPSRRMLAEELFVQGMEQLEGTGSPRTWAYGVLGLSELLKANPENPKAMRLMGTLSGRLLDCYEGNQSPLWCWFEQSLAYANARLPQALIAAAGYLAHPHGLMRGTESLAWLMAVQTGPDGVFAPIGSEGFYKRGGARAWHDQQPIEAAASVSACISAYRATLDPMWRLEAERAFRWFTGENTLGEPPYDSTTGGCCDGVQPLGLNHNQGAESTLSFLSSLVEMRSLTQPTTVPVEAWKLQ